MQKRKSVSGSASVCVSVSVTVSVDVRLSPRRQQTLYGSEFGKENISVKPSSRGFCAEMLSVMRRYRPL